MSATSTSILPFDADVLYLPDLLNPAQQQQYFDELLRHTPWQHDVVKLFGKTHITPRRVAWYAHEGYTYTYSNTRKIGLPFTPALLELKQAVEATAGCSFNSCLLNVYDNGTQSMGWHADDEPELGTNNTIASLSLGAARRFSFRHKVSRHTVSLVLAPGSLLLMRGATQAHWLHSLPRALRVTAPRINLTFRTILA